MYEGTLVGTLLYIDDCTASDRCASQPWANKADEYGNQTNATAWELNLDVQEDSVQNYELNHPPPPRPDKEWEYLDVNRPPRVQPPKIVEWDYIQQKSMQPGASHVKYTNI